MRVLAIGDVCGTAGCEAVRRLLPAYKQSHSIDFVIANGENSADGNGISPQSARYLFDSGIDVITGGNHTLRRHDIYSLLDENERLLRPDNLSCEAGSGYCIVDFGHTLAAVINLAGVIYMDADSTGNPFTAADRLIDRAKDDGARIIITDFHAEATSEKRALGFYLDGRVSTVFGTHTHIQTADEQILEGGTGYITDIGMTGPENSVLGVERAVIISRLKDGDLQKFRAAQGPCFLCGCMFEIDNKSGMSIGISRVILR